MHFPDLNTSPEINTAGAAFTPILNSFANNLTRWDLTVEDVQVLKFNFFHPEIKYCSLEAVILAAEDVMTSSLMQSGMLKHLLHWQI